MIVPDNVERVNEFDTMYSLLKYIKWNTSKYGSTSLNAPSIEYILLFLDAPEVPN
jgi:hypothetical protein